MRRLLWDWLRGVRHSRRRIGGLRPSFNPPDETHGRGEARLLIWRELPHWMVVDQEFHEFLGCFDGRQRADQIIGAFARGRREAVELSRQVEALITCGVLLTEGAPAIRREARGDASSRIANVSINVTRQCNLRCRFCYNLMALQRHSDEELTADQIIGFLRGLKGFLSPQPSVFLLGGEPLLHADKVLAVARFAVEAGFDVIVSTNGMGITREFAAAARKLGMQVQVSLDGPTVAVHDALRGAGSYRRALQGIEILVRERVHTIVSMVCMAENLPHIEAFYGLAVALGATEARVIPLKRLGGAAENGVTPVPLGHIFNAMLAMLDRRPEYSALMGRDCLSILAGQCQMAQPRSSCGTGVQTLLLDADGTLYPCLNTNRPEFTFGNVRENGFDFGRAWRTSPVLERVRRETSVEVAGNACRECVVKYWCFGGCHGETYAATGSLDSGSPDCEELRQAVMEMMWLISARPGWMRAARSTPC